MSSASSVQSIDTMGSSENPGRPGMMFVLTGIRDKSLPEQLNHDWYDEHAGIVAACPGNGGLMMRYRNADPTITAHAELAENLARRSTPSATGNEISEAGWPYLALVKVLDSNWYQTEGFLSMPRTSELFPRDPDGSLGNVFHYFNCGLRGYATIEDRWTDSFLPRPKYLVSVGLSDASAETFDAIDKAYVKLPNFRGTRRSELDSEKLGAFAEPGKLPVGLVLYHFDGDEVPQIQEIPHKSVVRQDAWIFFKEIGDSSLEL